MFKRQGLRMGDLSGPQREAVLGVLAATLSPKCSAAAQATFGSSDLWTSFVGDPEFRNSEISGSRLRKCHGWKSERLYESSVLSPKFVDKV